MCSDLTLKQISDLLEWINSREALVTTSSCSGRVCVFAEVSISYSDAL